MTLGGHSAGAELVDYAQTRNVTRVLLGEPSRRGIRALAAAIDDRSTCLRASAASTSRSSRPPKRCAWRKTPLLARSAAYLAPPPSSKRRWPRYVWAAVGVAAATAFAWITTSVLNEPNVVMIYLLAIALIAWRVGRGPSVVASMVSTLAYNFFFVPPLFTLNIADGQYLITFAVLTTVGVLIGKLIDSVRLQARVAGHRERRTALLYAMSRELAAVRGAVDMARVAVRHIGEVFEAQVAVLLPDADGKLRTAAVEAEPASLRSADLSVAQWVQDHGQPAGLGTDTLPGTAARYLPLRRPIPRAIRSACWQFCRPIRAAYFCPSRRICSKPSPSS